MKACVCVDYLSHEWSSTDLIQAHRELQRQKSKTAFNTTTKQDTATKKELKRLSIERVRQIRYQNAIWRQMARSCTNKLSWSNQMIHPSSVNWQKESDITWLYGPLYMPPETSSDLNTHPSLKMLVTPSTKEKLSNISDLKPVLKRNTSTASTVMLQKDYWITNDKHWSKCASESGKQSVRFNPNVTEVNFLPETPVKESFKTTKKPLCSYFNLDLEEEEDDDEEIWKVFIQVGCYLKSVFFSTLFATRNNFMAANKQIIKKQVPMNHVMIQFCVSAVSFTAWIMYQSFSTIINKTPFAPKNPVVKSSLLLERKNNVILV